MLNPSEIQKKLNNNQSESENENNRNNTHRIEKLIYLKHYFDALLRMQINSFFFVRMDSI